MDIEREDSQGKFKEHGLRARSALLTTALFIGACAGFVLAQVGYIYAQQHPGAWSQTTLSSRSMLANGHSWSRSLAASSQEALSANPDVIPLREGPPRNELERTLRIVAPPVGDRPPEVLIAVCTYNLVEEGLFGMFLDTLLQNGIKNYLIVGLDRQIRDHLVSKGLNVYYYQVDESEKIAGHNHAVSAKKFRILQSFLQLGYSVLLADIDIVVLKNPFDYLYRDHDVEGMTDGFDEGTAFGQTMPFDDPSMGWARYAQGTQHLNLNSGLFYIRANKRTVNLMARTATALQGQTNAWDQAEFNHQLFFLSHGDYINPGCTVRIMELDKFMNSKVLFKDFRNRPLARITGDNRPVMIHMNYHPDKYMRMRGAIQFFLQGDKDALRLFPGGSEPNS